MFATSGSGPCGLRTNYNRRSAINRGLRRWIFRNPSLGCSSWAPIPRPGCCATRRATLDTMACCICRQYVATQRPCSGQLNHGGSERALGSLGSQSHGVSPGSIAWARGGRASAAGCRRRSPHPRRHARRRRARLGRACSAAEPCSGSGVKRGRILSRRECKRRAGAASRRRDSARCRRVPSREP